MVVGFQASHDINHDDDVCDGDDQDGNDGNSNTKKFRTIFDEQQWLQYLRKYGKLRHKDKLGKLSSI